MMEKKELEKILIKIQGKHDVLKPSTLVEVAKPKDHPLHDYFEWEDSLAGEAYRLIQARQLIRTVVFQPFDNKPTFVRAFISLPSDRVESGYRQIKTVMSNKKLKAELLEDAKRQFSFLRIKYSILRELDTVWEQVDKLFK